MMVAMDTKFGRLYCAISDARNLLYFQLELPQSVTDRNETYGMGLQTIVSGCGKFATKIFLGVFKV